MASAVRQVVRRSGRYRARLAFPKDLGGIIGRTELRTPLGGDCRQAFKRLPGVFAELHRRQGRVTLLLYRCGALLLCAYTDIADKQCCVDAALSL